MKRLLFLFTLFLGLTVYGQVPLFHLAMSEWHTQPGVALTSGSLTSGKLYKIGNFVSGDNFTNVGASSNASGVVFVATGTTPTTWTNGSTLRQLNAFAPDLITGKQGTMTDVVVTTDRHGNGGERYYSFDGVDDYVTLPTQTAFGTGNFTVMAYLYVGAIGSIRYIFGGLNNSFSMYMTAAGKLITSKVAVADNTASSSSLSTGWQWIGYTRSGTSGVYYIGGSPDPGGAITDSRDYTAAPLYFSGQSGYYWLGYAKNIYIFNRALSAAEVLAYSTDNPILTFADRGATNTGATSGSLVVGYRYIITTFVAGDNFTNVGAASNATGVVFVATGTTPTTWANGSTLTRQGSTLSLGASGMYSSIWHDYDHAVRGTVSGATLVKPTGSNLGSYDFNATTSKVTYPVMVGLTGDRSFTGWFYALNVGEGSAGRIFGNGKIIIGLNSSNFLTFTRDSATVITTNPTTITYGKWYFYAITSPSSGNSTIYLAQKGDAAPVARGTAGSAGTPAAGTVHVYGNRTASDRTWSGRLDDIQAWPKLLTTAEILEIYKTSNIY